jgi:hypothetical protein
LHVSTGISSHLQSMSLSSIFAAGRQFLFRAMMPTGYQYLLGAGATWEGGMGLALTYFGRILWTQAQNYGITWFIESHTKPLVHELELLARDISNSGLPTVLTTRIASGLRTRIADINEFVHDWFMFGHYVSPFTTGQLGMLGNIPFQARALSRLVDHIRTVEDGLAELVEEVMWNSPASTIGALTATFGIAAGADIDVDINETNIIKMLASFQQLGPADDIHLVRTVLNDIKEVNISGALFDFRHLMQRLGKYGTVTINGMPVSSYTNLSW